MEQALFVCIATKEALPVNSDVRAVGGDYMIHVCSACTFMLSSLQALDVLDNILDRRLAAYVDSAITPAVHNHLDYLFRSSMWTRAGPSTILTSTSGTYFGLGSTC